MRVSDKIGGDFRNWQPGEIITITAGTGRGKSHFIKNKLYIHAKDNGKRILMLVHRLNCLDQFQYEIQKDNKTDVITLGTYQSIEHSSKRGVKSNLVNPSDFDYVVCDEFHYFMSDASFNNATDLSLKAILNADNSIKVFMSATGDYVERYLMNWKKLDIKTYPLPITYEFINTLTFFREKETIETYIKKAIKGNHKSIFFINDIEFALELHKKYEEYSMFNCSKSKVEYQHVDEDKINNMLENERFEDLILFTTSVMDTGVNIQDTELRNIVCYNILDVRVLSQCIGRKRFINEDDRKKGIHLVVSIFNNQQLGGHHKDFNDQIKHADYLLEHETEKYNKKFFRKNDKSNIIYDDTTQTTRETGEIVKKVNELAYFKRKIDIEEINLMFDKGRYGYCEYLKEWFDFKGRYILEEDEQHKETLEEYLDSIVGKQLMNDDQKELIEKIDVRVNRRQQRSYKKLNEGLEMIKLNYVILPKRNAKERYWEIHKVDNLK